MRERKGSGRKRGEIANRRYQIFPTAFAISGVIWHICVSEIAYFSITRRSVTKRCNIAYICVYGVRLHTTNVPGRVRITEEKRTKLRTVKDRKPRS